MPHTDPKTVKSPKSHWTLIDVLYNEGEGEHSMAIGEWKIDESRTKRCLALRWNGYDESPIGHPQSRGLPTWFIVPERYSEKLIETLPDENKKTIARALLKS